jgi:hypothetical protein
MSQRRMLGGQNRIGLSIGAEALVTSSIGLSGIGIHDVFPGYCPSGKESGSARNWIGRICRPSPQPHLRSRIEKFRRRRIWQNDALSARTTKHTGDRTNRWQRERFVNNSVAGTGPEASSKTRSPGGPGKRSEPQGPDDDRRRVEGRALI